MLDLQPAVSGVQKGYDATDIDGRTYQVKVRIVKNLSTTTSFDFKAFAHPFDYLVGVFLVPPFDVLAVVRVPFSEVVKHAATTRDGPRLRWNATTSAEPWVEYLYRA